MDLRPRRDSASSRQAELADLLFGVDDAVDLLEEPHVDLAGVVDVLDAHAQPHGFGDIEQAVGRRRAERRREWRSCSRRR